MKKNIVVGMSTLMAMTLLLSACGSPASSTSESTSSTAPKPSAASSSASSDAPKNGNENYSLKVSSWFLDDTSISTAFKQAAEKKFHEKYPNVKVQWDTLVGEKYMDKLKADLAAGSAADVIFSQNVAQFAKAGYLADLSNEPWAANVLDATKPLESYDGKLYGAAATVSVNGVFYNKKIFSDAGVQPPKTWDDFIAINEQLKAKKVTPIIAGFKDAWTIGLTLGAIADSVVEVANPNYLFDLYNGKAKLTGPEMTATTDAFLQLAKGGYFNKDALTLDWPGSLAAFEQGKAAMIIQGNWVPGMMDSDVLDKGMPKQDIGFFAIPNKEGKSALSAGPDHSISINAKSQHMQAAKDFVAMVLSQDVLSVHIKDVAFPGIKNIKGDFSNPAMTDVMNAMSTSASVVGVNSSNFLANSAWTGIQNGVLKVIGGGDFGDTLTVAQQNYDKDKGTIVIPKQ
ncbi:ABC transporter substrate-binding protein [Paenibacillus alba]|uniref:Extracellular solute-binding protein n=1 Tax=Paenibacillus alba TaxID=1197127 RepID=A0ABU6G406_9BACL|nr:extracellular solute-binding protein [Paenibacillus alba]MEC0227593.1 extracellular solute-binding protein [Paenibacillus alba]